MTPAPPRLLIRLGSLGDVVLATAAAEAALHRWGPGSLDVLVKAEWAPVWEGHPAVHRLWAWKPEDRGVSGLLRLAKHLGVFGYETVFDLQGNTRSRWLCHRAGFPRVERPRRFTLRRRLLARTGRFGPPASFRVHRAFSEIVDPVETVPRVYPDAQRAPEGVAPGAVGLVPGARHATKRWPLESFVAVGRRLAADTGLRVPVFLGPDEGDLRARLRVQWSETDQWVAVQKPLGVTAAALARLRGVVTNDTGIMHLAAAVGTPVVALFGPTVEAFGFFPAGEGHRVLEDCDLRCRPCSVHGGTHCPRGHFRCMLDRKPPEVLEAVAALGTARDLATP